MQWYLAWDSLNESCYALILLIRRSTEGDNCNTCIVLNVGRSLNKLEEIDSCSTYRRRKNNKISVWSLFWPQYIHVILFWKFETDHLHCVSVPVSALHCVLVPYLSLHCEADQRSGWVLWAWALPSLDQNITPVSNPHQGLDEAVISPLPHNKMPWPVEPLAYSVKNADIKRAPVDTWGLRGHMATLTWDCIPWACGTFVCLKLNQS